MLPIKMNPLGFKQSPIEVGYITSNGNVLVQLDWAFDSEEWLTAIHTITGSVSGASGSGTQYDCVLIGSWTINYPSSMTASEFAGFQFTCPYNDRRNAVWYGHQGWWNLGNKDNYTFNEFHVFRFQHSENSYQFPGFYMRDGNSITMNPTTTSDGTYTNTRPATYNNKKVILFGKYNYTTSDGFHFYSYNSWKFGGWKIELNNQVMHEYVPAIFGNVVGVWDKITNKFFKPIGTGTLTYGSR